MTTGGSALTQKVCNTCGERLPVGMFTPRGKGWRNQCRPCRNVGALASYHRNWTRARQQKIYAKRASSPKDFLRYLRGQALRRRRHPDFVVLEYLTNLWDEQGGRCALTNRPMTMILGRGIVQTNCSIDRIDSAKGYLEGNIQLVCRCANIAKNSLSREEFLRMCRDVVDAKN